MARYLIITGALFAFFAVAGQAIISVKLIELRARIQRDRILSLELSSQALEARARRLASRRADFRSEIRQSVVESGLLNSNQPRSLELELPGYAGLGAINLARMMAFKPLLYLFADYETLLLLRYAFYLERNRRFPLAARRYEALAEQLGNSQGDLQAFIALHHAYCLASMGGRENTDRALENLRAVRLNYAGTHFARAASILIHSMVDGRERSAQITKAAGNDLEQARLLVEGGHCPEALKAFERHRAIQNRETAVAVPLSPFDTYQESICLEETGQLQRAIAGYENVVRSGNQAAAVLANRRLLIVGKFYAGDEETTRQAENTARALGDGAALAEISRVASRQKESTVLTELREYAEGAARGETDDAPEWMPELHREITKELGPILPPLPAAEAGETPVPTPVPEREPAPQEQDVAAAPTELSIRDPARAHLDPGRIVLPELSTAASAGITSVQLSDGSTIPTRALRPASGGWQLSAPADTNIAADSAASIVRIRPADIAPGMAGILEIVVRGGRIHYAREAWLSDDRRTLQWQPLPDQAAAVPIAVETIRVIRTP